MHISPVKHSLPRWPQLVVASIFLFSLILLLRLPEHWANQLNYQSQAVLNGELWRLLTANLLHTNHWHLLLNLAGLCLLWLLHQRHFKPGHYWCWLLVAGILTNLVLLLAMPQLDRMVGLSGALHAMVVLGALADIWRKDSTGWLLLVLVLAKVAYEQIFGPDAELAALIAAQVAVDAHMAGVVAGFMLFPVWLFSQKK